MYTNFKNIKTSSYTDVLIEISCNKLLLALLLYSSLVLHSGCTSLIYRASNVGKKFKLRDVDASIFTSFNVGV